MEEEEDGSSLRRLFEAGEPRAGERSCGSPWAFCLLPLVGQVALYWGSEDPTGASQKLQRSGQARPGKRQVSRVSRALVPAG